MNVWDRKTLRQIERAADGTDVERACKMLIMVLKKKAQYLPNRNSKPGDHIMFTINGRDYTLSYELIRLMLITEPPSFLKAKL